jgi:hypothetical protein
MNEKNTYTGSSLEKALKSGTFERTAIELTGMVKASQKADHISFARGGCETWIDLPTSMIDEAERLGQRSCKEHTHPVFKITFKEPKDAVAQIFASLLAVPKPISSQTGPFPPQGWQGTAVGGFGGPSIGPQAGNRFVIPLPYGCIAYCYENWDGYVFCGYVC